jgi:hypothetical protein
VAAAAFAGAMAVGLVLLRWAASDARIALEGFEPLPLDSAGEAELLLDDPLLPIDEDSRVVRLFDRQPRTPGEMVARISDFLEVRPLPAQPAPVAGEAASLRRPPDASAALHEALASIRASLR